MSWTSQYQGWHARAQPHPAPNDFVPTRDGLELGVRHSTPAEANGFTLAFFSPNIAVDACGRILVVAATDFDGIVSLAKQTLDLPETGTYRNTWRIKQARTSQSIERLLVPTAGGDLKETSVYGYEKDKRELASPVGEITELPVVLWELFGLFEEAREEYERGKGDEATIEKVKAVLMEA